MNENRQQQLLASQSSVARKVYEAVPIQEAWSESTIHRALRLTGSTAQPNVVRACLGALEDSGLIYQPSRGDFRREMVTLKAIKAPKPIKPASNEPTMPKQTETKPTIVSPIDQLSVMATELTDLGTEFQLRLKKIAGRMEELALSIESQREADAAGMAKAHQLQALLKEFAA